MKNLRLPVLLLLALLSAASPLAAAKEEPKDETRLGEIAQTVARMLESAHYNRARLNQEVEPGVTQARKALDRYIELLDYNRLFFTQEDIDEFTSKQGEWLHEDILGGNLKPAYDIYDRFLQRVKTRVEKINALLDQGFTFDTDRTAQINRDKEPWPANEAEADKIWSARLEAELLQLTLAEKAMEEREKQRQIRAAQESMAAQSHFDRLKQLVITDGVPIGKTKRT
jgi:carboxyl-terminal processing protease